jgi:hypothetical protein
MQTMREGNQNEESYIDYASLCLLNDHSKDVVST